jgi:hypothetical protein
MIGPLLHYISFMRCFEVVIDTECCGVSENEIFRSILGGSSPAWGRTGPHLQRRIETNLAPIRLHHRANQSPRRRQRVAIGESLALDLACRATEWRKVMVKLPNVHNWTPLASKHS